MTTSFSISFLQQHVAKESQAKSSFWNSECYMARVTVLSDPSTELARRMLFNLHSLVLRSEELIATSSDHDSSRSPDQLPKWSASQIKEALGGTRVVKCG